MQFVMRGVVAGLGILAFLLVGSGPGFAGNATPYPGTQVIKTTHSFSQLRSRLEAAVKKNKVFVVTSASASGGAKSRGIKIPGNLVMGVYRNDFAVRMLAASVPAGIEAPLRFYLTENADGTATLTYRKPSAVFKPYGSADLDKLARELDAIWTKIAQEAVAR